MERDGTILGFKARTWGIFSLMLAVSSLSFGEVLPAARPSETAADSPKTTTGVASYYADKFHGRQTANGEIFDMHQLTAAHRTYKFGTRVKVTHLENKRSVIVRINDRGPYVKGRVIDLALGAAQELQMVKSGLAQVKLELVQ